jgi:hypothetical protein
LRLFGKSSAVIKHPTATLADLKMDPLDEGLAMPRDFVVPISKHGTRESPSAAIAATCECALADRSPNKAGAC